VLSWAYLHETRSTYELEGEIHRLANRQICSTLDPLVRATLVSFGFVLAHPYADGNGRLSRFLAHYTLRQSGALPNGYILPLSIAMKRNEPQYLQALQSFSRPARDLWSVLWIDRDNFTFEFKGHGSIYRYWDATPCVEFMYKMAEETLRHVALTTGRGPLVTTETHSG